MIPLSDFQDLIHEVQEKADIVNIISRYIKLEKKGAGYVGLCPFHDDKNPSLSVSPNKKIYKCFSCNASGNAITFVEKYKKVPFMEALREVAATVNISVAVTKSEQDREKNQKYYQVMSAAQTFYQFYLKNTQEGQEALNYLHGRHLEDDIIEHFGIGCSPSDMDLLYQSLLKQNHLALDMAEVGLIRLKENYYDVFRKRIMFPITDLNGYVVGFSGRKYHKESTEAKYVNSNETIIFKKGQILYKYHEAFDAIKQADSIILFEGFMDVIASFKAGVHHAVASMGTALTRDQIKAMKRLTSNITLCYDGDEPGVEATVRAIRMMVPEDLSIRVAMMKDELDPDEYLGKYGPAALKQALMQEPVSAMEFLYLHALKNYHPQDLSSMEHFKDEVFGHLHLFTSALIREVYFKKMADLMQIPYGALVEDFQKHLPVTTSPEETDMIPPEMALDMLPFEHIEPEKRRFNPKPKYIALQKALICLALHHPDRLLEIEDRFNGHYVLDEFREIMSKASSHLLRREALDLGHFGSELNPKSQDTYLDLIHPEIEPDITELELYFTSFDKWPWDKIRTQVEDSEDEDKLKVAIQCRQKTVKFRKKE